MGGGNRPTHLRAVVVLFLPNQAGGEGSRLLEQAQPLGDDLSPGASRGLDEFLNRKTVLVTGLMSYDEDIDETLRKPAAHIHALGQGLIQGARDTNREQEFASHSF